MSSDKIGPMHRRVAAGVAYWRNKRGWSLDDLSENLADIGRPIHAVSLSRLGTGQRRIDVDDLAALAKVFGVRPEDLLSPAEPNELRAQAERLMAEAKAIEDAWIAQATP